VSTGDEKQVVTGEPKSSPADRTRHPPASRALTAAQDATLCADRPINCNRVNGGSADGKNVVTREPKSSPEGPGGPWHATHGASALINTPR